MRKRIWLVTLVLWVIAGCGGEKPRFTKEQLAEMPMPQRTGLPDCSGGFVLVVGDELLTADEIVNPLLEYLGPVAQKNDYPQFERQVRGEAEQFVIGKIANILLYQQAKKELGDKLDERLEKLAEAEVRKFIVSFGGDYARAEHALKQEGMDWAGFKDYQKRIILSQSYISTKLPEERPATYGELLQTYNDMKEEFFTVPAKLEFATAKISANWLNATRTGTERHLADGGSRCSRSLLQNPMIFLQSRRKRFSRRRLQGPSRPADTFL